MSGKNTKQESAAEGKPAYMIDVRELVHQFDEEYVPVFARKFDAEGRKYWTFRLLGCSQGLFIADIESLDDAIKREQEGTKGAASEHLYRRIRTLVSPPSGNMQLREIWDWKPAEGQTAADDPMRSVARELLIELSRESTRKYNAQTRVLSTPTAEGEEGAEKIAPLS